MLFKRIVGTGGNIEVHGSFSLCAVGTTAANSTWIVPPGVTSVEISVAGAGGGGGGRTAALAGNGGSGGNGALVVASNVAVTPGETLAITGGAGGVWRGVGTTMFVRRGATTLVASEAGGSGGPANFGMGTQGWTRGDNGSLGTLAPGAAASQGRGADGALATGSTVPTVITAGGGAAGGAGATTGTGTSASPQNTGGAGCVTITW